MHELTWEEIDTVAGGPISDPGETIRAIGEVIDDIGDAFYIAGYRLGKALRP